ncbi:LAQU0S05e03642g1_1 [Lachancea quebecensis]|uniref:asparaginase n=1 Tax=Lachancea quebecensis TaxID=1654605 RepID=A0A0P1KR62_9SACH|nr:LAQU0S05e03642g1_1 [Lachancea quebecensis]
MRASLILSAICAAGAASPIAAVDDDDNTAYVIDASEASLTPWNVWPSWANASNASNYSNLSNATAQVAAPKLEVIVTGGHYALSNWSSEVHVTRLFNQSSLNATQLARVAQSVEGALDGGDYTGVVVLGAGRALEALGFYLSVVVDTPENVVVTSVLEDGIATAWSAWSWFRGALVVDGGAIYSGAAYSPSAPGWGALGAVVAGAPRYWFTPAWPTLLAPWGALRVNFTNFTDIVPAAAANATNSSAATVPIVFDGYYDPGVVSSLSSAIAGLVVVSSGNSTSSDLTSSSIPVVFASDDGATILPQDVPAGAIAGGDLSPLKAQLLLSIALSKSVKEASSLQQLFA